MDDELAQIVVNLRGDYIDAETWEEANEIDKKAIKDLTAWRATAVVEAREETIDWFMEHDGKLPPNIKATCLSELTNERPKV